jgi:hypothetical protein
MSVLAWYKNLDGAKSKKHPQIRAPFFKRKM